MRIKDFKPKNEAKINLLASGQDLKWHQEGSDVVVELPNFDPGNFESEDKYAYVFKISK